MTENLQDEDLDNIFKWGYHSLDEKAPPDGWEKLHQILDAIDARRHMKVFLKWMFAAFILL